MIVLHNEISGAPFDVTTVSLLFQPLFRNRTTMSLVVLRTDLRRLIASDEVRVTIEKVTPKSHQTVIAKMTPKKSKICLDRESLSELQIVYVKRQ